VPSASVLDFRSIDGALLRYRIVALIVSVSITILVFVALPLKIAGNDWIGEVLGPLHGVILYPLYIVLMLDLARRVRLHPVWAVLLIAIGTVPIVSFYAERRTTRFVRERQAALHLLPAAAS